MDPQRLVVVGNCQLRKVQLLEAHLSDRTGERSLDRDGGLAVGVRSAAELELALAAALLLLLLLLPQPATISATSAHAARNVRPFMSLSSSS